VPLAADFRLLGWPHNSSRCRRWGQQPTLYKATWKRFTRLLRASTQYATMLWAPNEGGGYPYARERHSAPC
jgi:hypothetical protein